MSIWTPIFISKISKKKEEEIYSRVKFETLDVKIKYVPSNVSQLIITPFSLKNGTYNKNLFY